MLVRQVRQKNAVFVAFKLYVCNGCHDILMMSTDVSDITICFKH